MAATEPHFYRLDPDAPLPFFLDVAPELIGTCQSFVTVDSNNDFDSYFYQSTGWDVGLDDCFPGAAQRTAADALEDTSTPRETKQSPQPPQFSESSKPPCNLQENDANLEKPTSMADKSTSNNIITKRRQPQSNHFAASGTRLVKGRPSKETSRERNRKSAMKFRTKRKELERDLEARQALFETKHRILKAEYGDLLRETLKLKNDVIIHAACHSCSVDAWIHGAAEKFCRELSGARTMSPDSGPSP